MTSEPQAQAAARRLLALAKKLEGEKRRGDAQDVRLAIIAISHLLARIEDVLEDEDEP